MEPDHCPEQYPASPHVIAAWIGCMFLAAAIVAWSLL
jgi:hypothetical protein